MIHMTVLLVDDEKEIADLVEAILKNEGYDVRKFYDSTAALCEHSTPPIPCPWAKTFS